MLNNVKITQNYALKTDDMNFIVLQRKVIDPTKSPSYKPEPDVPVPPTREEWVLAPAPYYPLTTAGLTALIDNVRLREATDSEISSLADLAYVINETTAEIIAAVTAGLSPEFSVKMGAQM